MRLRLRRRSFVATNVSWACATVAPWILAGGVLVSFTASAGQAPNAEIEISPLRSALVNQSAVVVPDAGSRLVAPMIALPGLRDALRTASLSFEAPKEHFPREPETPLRDELKSAHDSYPAIDRSGKGDPLVALRPSLSRRGLELPHGAQVSFNVVFAQSERVLPQTVFMPGSTEIPAVEDMHAFEPLTPEDLTLTEQAMAPRSPDGPGSDGTTPVIDDGSTPSTPRAVALASTTPAPADAVPMEIAAAPVSPLGLEQGNSDGVSAVAKSDDSRPDYASLVDAGRMGSEERCLAEAVYFEARSESEEGQAAVAQVVLNRVKSGLYPSTICGVVFQNRSRYKACQFSFACEGRSLRITEQGSWDRARRIADEVLNGKMYVAEVGGATHYHANYVRPRWAKRLKKMDVIGRHIFYKLRPGQT
jgi:spore germination cell wall hydrolase CwlJ-like protein